MIISYCVLSTQFPLIVCNSLKITYKAGTYVRANIIIKSLMKFTIRIMCLRKEINKHNIINVEEQ